MVFAAVFASLSVFCMAIFVWGLIFRESLAVKKRLDGMVEKNGNVFNEELDKPFAERFVRPMLQKMLSALSPHGRQRDSESDLKLARDLRLGGIMLEPQEFQMLQLVVMFLLLGAFAVPAVAVQATMAVRLLILLFGLILGVLIPRYYLTAHIKSRQNKIRLDLPDVMDLLSVSVEAGLGFDAALLHVCNRQKDAHKPDPLSDELMVAYREIRMGKPRREALVGLGERNDVDELRTFCGAMAQADQLGIPIRNVLRSQAAQLRLGRRQRAEEKAMKAPIKMIIPLVVFIFPVLFIILLGPAVLQIITAFSAQ